MNPILSAPIADAVGKTHVDVVAAPLLESKAFPVQKELDGSVGRDRHMYAHLAVVVTEIGVGVLPNKRTHCEIQKSHRLRSAVELREEVTEVTAPLQDFRIEELIPPSLMLADEIIRAAGSRA